MLIKESLFACLRIVMEHFVRGKTWASDNSNLDSQAINLNQAWVVQMSK